MSFCYVELVETLLVHRYSVDIFHTPVLQKYWDFAESRIARKLRLGCVGFLYFPLILIYRFNETYSVVFTFCSFSLLLNNPFSRFILRIENVCSCGREHSRNME